MSNKPSGVSLRVASINDLSMPFNPPPRKDLLSSPPPRQPVGTAAASAAAAGAGATDLSVATSLPLKDEDSYYIIDPKQGYGTCLPINASHFLITDEGFAVELLRTVYVYPYATLPLARNAYNSSHCACGVFDRQGNIAERSNTSDGLAYTNSTISAAAAVFFSRLGTLTRRVTIKNINWKLKAILPAHTSKRTTVTSYQSDSVDTTTKMVESISMNIAGPIDAFNATVDKSASLENTFNRTITRTLNTQVEVKIKEFDQNMFIWVLQISGTESADDGGGEFTLMAEQFTEFTETSAQPKGLKLETIVL